MYKTGMPNEKFGQRGVDLLRAIDKTVKKVEGDENFQLTDLDMAPDSEEEIEIEDYDEARYYLKQHTRQLLRMDHEPHWKEHLLKIMSIEATLDDFEHASTDRRAVARDTLGIWPKESNEREISRKAKQTDELGARQGEEKILSTQEMESRAKEVIAWAGKVVPQQIILPPEFEGAAGIDPLEGVSIKFVVDPDAWWIGGFHTTNRQPELKFNKSSIHQYTDARVQAVGIHEVVHANHAALKRWAALNRIFSRFFAITTTTGREVVTMEVLAQGLEQRLLRANGYKRQAVLHDAAEQVWNNAQFRIDRNETDAEVFEYISKRPHPQTPEGIKASIKSRREDKVARIYVYSYEAGLLIVRNVLKLSDDDQQMRVWGKIATTAN
jgi:hypothetical protein